MNVDLILLSQSDEPPKPLWSLGQVYILKPDVQNLNTFTAQHLATTRAEAWLFWDTELGQPDAAVVQKALSGTADVWHAGLALGMRGLPGMIDFVSPNWMLNCDPAPEIEATSWRVSLRACLVRTDVLRQMGFLAFGFQSLEAAGLEWGHRCIRRGVMMRHLPDLIDPETASRQLPPALPVQDEIRFVRCRFGLRWTLWAALRAVLTGCASPKTIYQSLGVISSGNFSADPSPFQCLTGNKRTAFHPNGEKVSVLIPTVERYPYLETILGQLRQQTHLPHEIIIIDQTPEPVRDMALYNAFTDLPLKVIFMNNAGQCSSRNAGLQASVGEYVLFIDDDDELPPDLIAAHLEHLHQREADVSAGVANEVGAGSLPPDFTYRRISDVFPTNNSLLRRTILARSGLFDLAYDHGARADGDLGMRLYLNGNLMILNPAIQVLHHHAARGGLRKHKARVITYAGSRKSILQRHLPSATEIYLASRYFSPVQLREMLLISLLGTFSLHGGNWIDRILKVILSTLCLPFSVWTILANGQQAREMLRLFPRIPCLPQAEQTRDGLLAHPVSMTDHEIREETAEWETS